MSIEQTTHADETLAPRPKRRRCLTVLLSLAVFGAGLVTGAGLTVLVVVKRVQYAIQHPETAPARVAGLLQRRLKLDDAQKSQVESIVAKRQVALMAIRREHMPQVTSELKLLREEIAGVLTEAQRERWTELFDELREKWMPPMPAEAGKPKKSA